MAEPPKARPGWNDSFNKTLKGGATANSNTVSRAGSGAMVSPKAAPPVAKPTPAIPKVKSVAAYAASPAGRQTSAAVAKAGGAPLVAKPAPKSPAAAPTKAGLSPFGTAFAAARKSGAKEFSFGGKSYTTKIKGQ